MREYRGKRKDTGVWIFGWYHKLDNADDLNKAFIIPSHASVLYSSEVDPSTVGQYTGLKDRNGKEIHEGDIFKAPHDFGPGGFSWRMAAVKFHESKGYQWEYWLLDQLEVIGNIHDNPELLEVTV